MMNRRLFSAALGASSLTAACQGDKGGEVIGKPLPSIKGVYSDGTGFDLAAISKPAVIRFWGLWCAPCMIDMPNWLSVVRQLRTGDTAIKDMNVLTVHVGKAPATGPTLAQWTAAQALDIATPVIDDPLYVIAKAIGVIGTPSTLYVNEKGIIEEHAWAFKNQRGVATFLRKVAYLHQRGAR
jgi:thiol-disulfide isomerase/thioredoxin